MSWRTARTPPMTSPAATPRPPRQLPPPPRTPCLPSWKEPPQPPPQRPQPTRGRRRGSPRPRHPPGTKSVPSSRSKTVKKLSRSGRGKCRLLEAETETRKVEAPPPPPLPRPPPPLHRQTLRRVRHERCDDRFPSLLYWLNDGVAAEKWHFYFVKNYLYTDFGKGQTNSGDY